MSRLQIIRMRCRCGRPAAISTTAQPSQTRCADESPSITSLWRRANRLRWQSCCVADARDDSQNGKREGPGRPGPERREKKREGIELWDSRGEPHQLLLTSFRIRTSPWVHNMFPCEYSEIRSGNVQPDVQAVIPAESIIHTCPFATPFIAYPTALTQPHASHAISTSSIPDRTQFNHPLHDHPVQSLPANRLHPTSSDRVMPTQPHLTNQLCHPRHAQWAA